MEKRSYKFGASYLHLIFGDITTSDAQVLVSSDDYNLTMRGGVSAALRRAAGEALLVDVAKKATASLGDVVVTTAGALSAEHIFHAITIGRKPTEKPPMKVVEQVTGKCLRLLSELGLNSIAFPAIGTGVARYSTDEVAFKMAEVISEFLKKNTEEFHVSIYLHDRFGIKSPIDFITFFEQFASRIGAPPTTEPKKITRNAFETRELSERSFTTKQLSELTRERENIELKLSELNGDDAQGISNGFEERLEEIYRQRIDLLKQLSTSNTNGVRLFISYSHKDMEFLTELKSHLKALERVGLVTSWHDRLISAGTEWKGVIDDNLNQSDVILFLISASFVESQYCFDIELDRALTRHKNKEALVVPILIRPVVWHDLPFAKLQSLPNDGRPVSTWPNSDLAWVDIIESLKTAIRDFQSRKRP